MHLFATMMKKIGVFIGLLISFSVMAQNKATTLKGFVKYDSIPLPYMHIINTETKLATSSNLDGSFTIKAKKGDILLFTSISFLNRKIKITDTHINSKSITVYLEPEVNELGEVNLEHLTIKYTPADIHTPNFNADHTATPDARTFTDPTYASGTSGMDLIGIASSFIINPLLNVLLKGQRERKRKEAIAFEKKYKFTNTIRNTYDDYFFTNTLKIPKDKINLFIEFCEEKELEKLYNKSKLETVDFFIKKAKEYNSLSQTDFEMSHK